MDTICIIAVLVCVVFLLGYLLGSYIGSGKFYDIDSKVSVIVCLIIICIVAGIIFAIGGICKVV